MDAIPPILAEVHRLAYAPPLLLAASLVYAGTRHEDLGAILRHAGSFGGWTAVFMLAVAAVIELMAYFQ